MTWWPKEQEQQVDVDDEAELERTIEKSAPIRNKTVSVVAIGKCGALNSS